MKADYLADAERCIELKGNTQRCSQVNAQWLTDAMAASVEVAKKQDAQRVNAENAKRNAEQQAVRQRVAKIKAEKEAKFKAEGWFEVSVGIYGRWCTKTCNQAGLIGNQSYFCCS
ncbi:hypothetical protein PMIT1342_00428 [Prochlorococcus marinus str. MIT 1342]|uniref:hypothetical protein n=1 Tax=Prochlorococcus TaxID=1218 RepID=UPI0007B3EF2B|nr:hypothetical protein [Prochlorococcus marinus]KZR83071.1 hypothetical protein PMIT1342_00428 [Prochlorococcus marinus str. MIT 1342]